MKPGGSMTVDEAIKSAPSVEDIEQLMERVRPALAGQHPTAVGAVLAQCVAIWLSGHHPEMRQDVRAHWERTLGEFLHLFRDLWREGQ